MQDKNVQKLFAHDCLHILKDREAMLRLCRMAANEGEEVGSESDSDSSDSRGIEFGIQGPMVTADAEPAALEDDEDEDEILPLWTFDPEQALSEDLEELSEVLTLT